MENVVKYLRDIKFFFENVNVERILKTIRTRLKMTVRLIAFTCTQHRFRRYMYIDMFSIN